MNTRSSIKEIYILQLDGEVGAFIPSKYPTYSYAPKDEFIGFIEFLRDSYPEHKLRCIRNQGIEDWLKKRILKDKMLDKLR
jgi:hypothetical protein